MLPMLRSRFATPSMFEPWGELRREIDRLFDAAITGTPNEANFTNHIVSLSGGALLANVISVIILIAETISLRR